MKKLYLCVLTLILFISIFFIWHKDSKKQILDEVNLKENIVNKKQFAMYVQDSISSDNYSEYTESDIFPSTLKYSLNINKSKCMDNLGKEVTSSEVVDAVDNKITVTSSKTVYCTFYFDLDTKVPAKPTLTALKGTAESDFTLTNNYTHTKEVKVSASWSDDDVTSYCLTSAENSDNCEWIPIEATAKGITEETYTLTSDTQGIHTINLYIKDAAGNRSIASDAKTITLDTQNPTATVAFSSKTNTSIVTLVGGSDDGYEGSGLGTMYAGTSTTNLSATSSTYTANSLTSGNTYIIYAYVTDKSGRKSPVVNSGSIRTYYCATGTYQNHNSYGSICTSGPESKIETKTATEETNLDQYSASGGRNQVTAGTCQNICLNRCGSAHPDATNIRCQSSQSGGITSSSCRAVCYGYLQEEVTTYSCKDGWQTLSGTEASMICYKKADD